MSSQELFEKILTARGLEDPKIRADFLSPGYENQHDPFLLPDMEKAVKRLVSAHKTQEKITIYGDYDIDGLTATALLLDAFNSFGFKHVDAFIPNRFVEGYGMTVDAVERIAKTGAQLIVTVDCGSLSHEPIKRAKELGIDVIVTDHHNVADKQPPAVAVINPKRLLEEHPECYKDLCLTSSHMAILSHDKNRVSSEINHKSSLLYPFLDLPGVGVAFKLVQALQTELKGLPKGHEKWLLDLVALGTVCDVVTVVDENRMHVYWGLQVLKKTQRSGLKALMAVAGVEAGKVTARSLGFALGPRMNAAGRLETAQVALDLLTATDPMIALKKAEELNELNTLRRIEQDSIYKEAIKQAKKYINDPVLVVSSPGWNHGIVGIVAAKLLEKYKKPTFVLEEMGEESKGSARSYGDFSVADAIRTAEAVITKGGGHKAAAGVTLPTKNIEDFRTCVNGFYRDQKFNNQAALLLPQADASTALEYVTEDLVKLLESLEPFGNGNPQPILRSEKVLVINRRRMGTEGQHVKLEVQDESGWKLYLLAFGAPEHFFVEPGERITIWYQPDINEWQGRRSVEGRLLRLEIVD